MRPTPVRARRTRTLTLAVVLIAGTAGACSPGSMRSSPSSSGSMIVRAQFENESLDNAQDIVNRFRPAWLRPRNQGTFTSDGAIYPAVYLNNVRFGEIDSLSSIRAIEIESIRYIGATEATTTFGTNVMGGVIQVRTR